MLRKTTLTVFAVAVSIFGLASMASAQSDSNKLVVMDLHCGAVLDEMSCNALTNTVMMELVKSGQYQVVDALTRNSGLQSAGVNPKCVDVGCAVGGGRALGAGKVVIGSVTKLGDTYTVNLQLIDVSRGASEVSKKAKCKQCQVGDLPATAQKAANKLMGTADDVDERAAPSPGAATGGPREKILVAVGTFSDETGKNLGSKASDAVTNTFVKLKYFRILERNHIDQVMKEIAHQQTGFVDESTAIEVGHQLGAKVMVVGTVTSAGYNIEKQKYKDADGNTRIQFVAYGRVSLSVRMVDVETGKVVFSQTINGEASDTFKKGSTAPPENVMLDKAVQQAAHSFYGPIQEAFPLIGTVIKKDGQWVYIDFGSDWGVGWRRGLIFYRETKPIKHPVTGQIVGYEREELARDGVAEVMPTMCKAKLSRREAEKVKVGDKVMAKPEIFY